MNKRYRLGEIEEAVSEMEELIGLEDDIAEIDDDFQIVVSGWSVYVESLNLTLRQGIACVWDAEEGLFMPDFDVTIVYEGNIETQEWLYYEQDGMVVTLGNWLNGRLSCEQIEQLWCELIIPEQNKADAYSGYNAVSGVKRCLCYTHLRRAFVEALPPDQKKKERLIREKPLLEAFWSWAEKSAIGELPKSKLSKAFHYALNNREGFWNYLEDGNCSISNSLAENCIRPFVIGRKNWLFSGSPKGAEASAGIYTLFYLTLTAKA